LKIVAETDAYWLLA